MQFQDFPGRGVHQTLVSLMRLIECLFPSITILAQWSSFDSERQSSYLMYQNKKANWQALSTYEESNVLRCNSLSSAHAVMYLSCMHGFVHSRHLRTIEGKHPELMSCDQFLYIPSEQTIFLLQELSTSSNTQKSHFNIQEVASGEKSDQFRPCSVRYTTSLNRETTLVTLNANHISVHTATRPVHKVKE